MADHVTIGELIPQGEGKNARKHTPRNIGMIAASLQEVGAARSIVIDENNEILAGNGTWEAAGQVGIERVRVVEADGNELIAVRRIGLTDAQKKRLAVADNRTAELAEWDGPVLAGLQDEGILDGLFADDELAKLLADLNRPEPGGGGDEFDTTPQDGPTRVQRGDVWRLGEHRLMCGDSTSADDVARLMGGGEVAMVWTDPPYGVGYQDNESIESLKARNRRTDGKVVQNDSLTEADTEALITSALHNIEKSSVPGGACYVACPAGTPLPYFIRAFDASGFGFRHSLVWVKDQFVFGRADYHYQHEIILYGWKNGTHYFTDSRKHTSVFEVPRPRRSEEHPTMKPIELVVQMVENSSKSAEAVYDPFLGSGTTLIAAQRTGRKCYGMEIEPRYCDVILRRAEAEGIGPIELVSNDGAQE